MSRACGEKSIPWLARSAVLLIALAAASCSSIVAQDGEQLPTASVVTQGRAVAAITPYTLGPGDRVRIKVFNEAELSGEYEINTSGFVSLPLAGQIQAAGQTATELERAITKRLASGIIRQPRVNVEMATYRPFYIYGEVKKAGEYPFRAGLTVADAVAIAGGYTYRANEGKVFLRRAGRPNEEAYDVGAAMPLYPGDNIRIPERYF